MRRRDFLQSLAALAGVQLLPLPAEASVPAGHFLVLIELKGGNDDLYSYPLLDEPMYSRLRPNLTIPSRNVVALSAERGLHPTLAPLKRIWDEHEMALVQGLIAGPSELSHFRAGQRWETGTTDQPNERTGWLARAWNETSSAAAGGKFDAAVFGFNSGVLRGRGLRLLELNGIHLGDTLPVPDSSGSVNPTMAHLQHVYQDWTEAQRALKALGQQMPPPKLPFPSQPIGQGLFGTAALMHSESPPAIYKLVLGSFDTHASQRLRQEKLWTPFVSGLLAFRSVLQQSGLWRRTTIATYSEFGRRVAENGSRNGTDHGGASTQMVLGGAVRGGFYGERPRLAELDTNGNIPGTLDFRRYYNTLWLEALAQPRPAFDVTAYPSLGLISSGKTSA